jgi:hypothetical protein
MSLDAAFNIAVMIISALGGWWLKNMQDETKRLRDDLANIRQDYQRRDDARTEREMFMQLLSDIKKTMGRIETKIDNKADKT